MSVYACVTGRPGQVLVLSRQQEHCNRVISTKPFNSGWVCMVVCKGMLCKLKFNNSKIQSHTTRYGALDMYMYSTYI